MEYMSNIFIYFELDFRVEIKTMDMKKVSITSVKYLLLFKLLF